MIGGHYIVMTVPWHVMTLVTCHDSSVMPIEHDKQQRNYTLPVRIPCCQKK